MTRHLILALSAAVILIACKTAPRENTYPREDVANTEVQRNNFYQGVQVTPRSTTRSAPSRTDSAAVSESRSTPRPAPTPTPKPTPESTPTPSISSSTPASQSTPAGRSEEAVPFGKPVPGKPGYVTSPYSPDAGYIDVTGFAPGTKARDPYTNKIFRVP